MATLLLLLLFLITTIHAHASSSSSSSSCFPSDLQALTSFAAGLHFTSIWVNDWHDDGRDVKIAMNESWNSEADCCSWQGVTCTTSSAPTTTSHARVTALSLYFEEFSVSSPTILESLCNLPLLSTLQLVAFEDQRSTVLLQIPECLGEQLPFLQVLLLSGLNLTGPIPSSFSRLRHLGLSYNYYLPGPLLPLLHVPTLTSLSLDSCAFSGSLPTFSTPLLQSLSLSHNHLNSTLDQLITRLSNLTALTHLDLSYNSISGSIPSSISRLFHLQYLSLDYNSLSGSIPSSISGLVHLQSLSLNGNSLSGPIPSSISRLIHLQSLSLYVNSLSGPIPSSISGLVHLQYLSLDYNSLSGPIPSSISRLVHLQSLSLAGNSLSGPLPDSMCVELINLTRLDLSSNNFNGTFPPCIGHFSSLAHLDLSSNHFASPIPHEWQNLKNLEYIDLGSGNSLQDTARLPEWLFRFPNLASLRLTSLGLQSEDVNCSTRLSMLNNTLQSLYLSGNNITGSDLLECFALHNFKQRYLVVSLSENPLSIVLSHIQLAPSISSLYLSTCNLRGILNDKVLNLPDLDLSHNNLVGKIPTKHTNLTKMKYLDLSNNYFTGFDSYGSFQSLRDIRLSHNLISGDVSAVLQSLGLNCTKPEVNTWEYLDLAYNDLVGQVPASLARCAQDLSSLDLGNNNLTGIIPGNFGEFNDLYFIALNNNHLNGIMPASIMTETLAALEVSHNDLEGDLKNILSLLKGPAKHPLVVLGLAHNHISGSIPQFLGRFTPSLHIIDISHNNLTGNIPGDLHLPSFQDVQKMTTGDIHEGFKALYLAIPPLVIKGAEHTLEYVWENFKFLDLSGNVLEGAIPTELGDLSAMMQLNLSHNRLSGPIPEALGKLLLLEALDLSYNNLQGHIPSSLSSLTKLSVFNVSYNEALEGSIPPGSQLENNESYIGDTLLCSYQVLQRACPPEVDVTLTTSNNMSIKDNVATWMDEWVAMPGLWLGIVVGFFGILWLLHGAQLP